MKFIKTALFSIFCLLIFVTPSFAATIIVNTLEDEFDLVANSTCSLREAVEAVNSQTEFGGCPAGNGDNDTITLGEGEYILTRSDLQDLNAWSYEGSTFSNLNAFSNSLGYSIVHLAGHFD